MRAIKEFKTKSFLLSFFTKKRPFFSNIVGLAQGGSFKTTNSAKADYVALRFGLEPGFERDAIKKVEMTLIMSCIQKTTKEGAPGFNFVHQG